MTNYNLSRDRIILLEILGEGQFGDVYKGTLIEEVSAINKSKEEARCVGVFVCACVSVCLRT